MNWTVFSIIFILYYLFIVDFLLSLMLCFIYYSDTYFSLTIDMINILLQLISDWKKTPLYILVYYILVTSGYSITVVGIKIFIIVSMMIGNIIDIYLLGIIIVLINWLLYSNYIGLMICSYILYLFLTRIELFIFILLLLESFSIVFQSLTLSNRLSINILSGCLLIELVSITLIIVIYSIVLFVLFYLFTILNSFEIINSLVQLFIFSLLGIEYLS